MVLYNEHTVEVLLEFTAPGDMLHDPGLRFTNLSLLVIRRSGM
jgi:hypothetical protein